jgi:hypothetical protein
MQQQRRDRTRLVGSTFWIRALGLARERHELGKRRADVLLQPLAERDDALHRDLLLDAGGGEGEDDDVAEDRDSNDASHDADSDFAAEDVMEKDCSKVVASGFGNPGTELGDLLVHGLDRWIFMDSPKPTYAILTIVKRTITPIIVHSIVLA